MDPEIYVFPDINSGIVKTLASTLLFTVVLIIVLLVTPWLPGPHLWSEIDRELVIGSFNVSLSSLLHLLIGYSLFIYASIHAWKAMKEKNSVEDPTRRTARSLLDTGYYGVVRHPMYGMFILANAGLGFAVKSVYGLGFILLSLALYTLNGIFEERAFLLPAFGKQYEAYMKKVTARYLTPLQAIILIIVLAINTAAIFFR